MQINVCSLLRLPVFTESGAYLGRVCDASLDLGNNLITKYKVRRGYFKRRTFFVSPSQVISISLEKMVVSDALLKDIVIYGQTNYIKNQTLNPATSPIIEQ